MCDFMIVPNSADTSRWLVLLTLVVISVTPLYCHPSIEYDDPSVQRLVPEGIEKAFMKATSLDETIDEVQKLLHQDASLPRLTKSVFS